MEALHILLSGPRLLSSIWTIPGVGMILAGLWLHTAGYVLFQRRRTTLATLEVPSLLVTAGPFRFTRNPMYAAGILILCGVGLVLGTAGPLLVPALFLGLSLRWYVRPEEELLEREFGEEYIKYRRRVRRWI